MTSCPGESALTRLVDGDLAPEREAEVLDHLALCDDCRSLLGRSEAALRYALGGTADAGDRPAPAHVEHARTVPRQPARARMRVLAAALLATAVVAGGVGVAAWRPQSPAPQIRRILAVPYTTGGVAGPAPWDTHEGAEPDRLAALLARAEKLAAPATSRLSEERDLLALGALAAAETRGTVLGAAPGTAGLRDVVATFPGTAAARVATQRLAALEPPR